jgi:hypothetical protein
MAAFSSAVPPPLSPFPFHPLILLLLLLLLLRQNNHEPAKILADGLHTHT